VGNLWVADCGCVGYVRAGLQRAVFRVEEGRGVLEMLRFEGRKRGVAVRYIPT